MSWTARRTGGPMDLAYEIRGSDGELVETGSIVPDEAAFLAWPARATRPRSHIRAYSVTDLLAALAEHGPDVDSPPAGTRRCDGTGGGGR